MITFDSHEVSALATDLGKIGGAASRAMVGVFTEGGHDLVAQWRTNARATSGTHGRYYPYSIDMELQLSTDIVVEVGPNPSKRQGGMSFENGSVNQPPHLDGQRAADETVPKLQRRVDAALGHILEGP